MPVKKSSHHHVDMENGNEEQIPCQSALIVENSVDAIISKTLDGIITSWNGGAVKMFGYSAKEAIGKSALIIYPPEIRDELPAMMKKAKAGKAIIDHDSVRLHKNGKRIDIAFSSSPIKEGGKVIGISCIERDITKRKEAEKSMRQIQSIVDHSRDAIIGTTLNGVVTSWNGGAVKMFGYSAKEVIGKSGSTLFPPEMWEKVPALLNKIKLKESVPDYDITGLRKDGTRFNMAVSISPIVTEEGNVIGASVVERDISGRKQETAKLIKLQKAINSSSDAFFLTDKEGIFTFINPAFTDFYGFTASEVIGKVTPRILKGGSRTDDDYKKFWDALTHKREVRDEFINKRKNNTPIYISETANAILDENNNIIGFLGIQHDITEREEVERHIKELNEYRGKFIEIISHQLGTPLTAVNWNLETLLNGDFGQLEETQKKFLQATQAASIKITHRIHNLLMAMDAEEGRINYTTNEIDMNNLYAGVINEAQKECKKKAISCRYASAIKKIAPIYGDGEKIRTAILILIENAITYTKNKGKIIFKLGSKDDIVRFEVADTGIGIPQPEQKMIFTRFFRASNASVMQPDAFGLGLFLAKSIIEQHRGKIGFKSKEGKGSTFWFEMPIKPAK